MRPLAVVECKPVNHLVFRTSPRGEAHSIEAFDLQLQNQIDLLVSLISLEAVEIISLAPVCKILP